jgi:hypothetical protein
MGVFQTLILTVHIKNFSFPRRQFVFKVMKFSVQCAEDESTVLCVWCNVCGGVRGQSACFVCGIRCVEGSGVRLPFCVWYKMCGGVRGQSACFVCGIRCVEATVLRQHD